METFNNVAQYLVAIIREFNANYCDLVIYSIEIIFKAYFPQNELQQGTSVSNTSPNKRR